MKPGGYSVYEELWLERFSRHELATVSTRCGPALIAGAGLLPGHGELPPALEQPGCRTRVDGRCGQCRPLAQ